MSDKPNYPWLSRNTGAINNVFSDTFFKSSNKTFGDQYIEIQNEFSKLKNSFRQKEYLDWLISKPAEHGYSYDVVSEVFKNHGIKYKSSGFSYISNTVRDESSEYYGGKDSDAHYLMLSEHNKNVFMQRRYRQDGTLTPEAQYGKIKFVLFKLKSPGYRKNWIEKLLREPEGHDYDLDVILKVNDDLKVFIEHNKWDFPQEFWDKYWADKRKKGSLKWKAKPFFVKIDKKTGKIVDQSGPVRPPIMETDSKIERKRLRKLFNNGFSLDDEFSSEKKEYKISVRDLKGRVQRYHILGDEKKDDFVFNLLEKGLNVRVEYMDPLMGSEIVQDWRK